MFDNDTNKDNLIASRIKIKKYGNGNYKVTVRPVTTVAELIEKEQRKLNTFLQNGGNIDNYENYQREKDAERKRLSGVKSRFLERANSVDTYNYFITLTTDNIDLANNGLELHKCANDFMKEQAEKYEDTNYSIVLETFVNYEKGYHIHGVSDFPIDLDEWIRLYGGSEGFDNDDIFYEPYNNLNLYCEKLKYLDKDKIAEKIGNQAYKMSDEEVRKYAVDKATSYIGKKIKLTKERICKETDKKNFRIYSSNVTKEKASTPYLDLECTADELIDLQNIAYDINRGIPCTEITDILNTNINIDKITESIRKKIKHSLELYIPCIKREFKLNRIYSEDIAVESSDALWELEQLIKKSYNYVTGINSDVIKLSELIYDTDLQEAVNIGFKILSASYSCVQEVFDSVQDNIYKCYWEEMYELESEIIKYRNLYPFYQEMFLCEFRNYLIIVNNLITDITDNGIKNGFVKFVNDFYKDCITVLENKNNQLAINKNDISNIINGLVTNKDTLTVQYELLRKKRDSLATDVSNYNERIYSFDSRIKYLRIEISKIKVELDKKSISNSNIKSQIFINNKSISIISDCLYPLDDDYTSFDEIDNFKGRWMNFEKSCPLGRENQPLTSHTKTNIVFMPCIGPISNVFQSNTKTNIVLIPLKNKEDFSIFINNYLLNYVALIRTIP